MSYLTDAQKETLRAMRKALDGYVAKIADDPAEVNGNAAVIRPWRCGVYAVGDVRMHEGIPYRCVQAHDSTLNEDWNPPMNRGLWMQYHGTSRETARPWLAPLGAHDMYLAGEWMIWTDGGLYVCMSDTAYNPVDHSQAWRRADV